MLEQNFQFIDLIIQHLDAPAAAALARTNTTFARLCEFTHGHDISPFSNTSSALVEENIRRGHLGAANSPQSIRDIYTQGKPPQISAMLHPATSAGTGRSITFKDMSVTHVTGHYDLVVSDQEYDTTGQNTPQEDEVYTHPITAEAEERIAAIPRHDAEATLPGLPTELQQNIFRYLDKIDSVCLGLTSRHAYAMFKAIYGTGMELNIRRIGPNTLESCWEILGIVRCHHCVTERCELWRHIKSSMPKELEYCSMKRIFGSRARPGASPSCYRNKPSKPKRCGRHPERTTTMHQDDNLKF